MLDDIEAGRRLANWIVTTGIAAVLSIGLPLFAWNIVKGLVAAGMLP